MPLRPLNLRKALATAAVLTIAAAAFGQAVDSGTVADIIDRVRPLGELCIEGQDCGGDAAPPAPAAALSGGDVYGKFCRTCHETGLNEAPKLGDAEAWAPRIAKGMEVMLQTTKDGLNLMPAMGLCMACSDAELEAAIDYMIGEADGPLQ